MVRIFLSFYQFYVFKILKTIYLTFQFVRFLRRFNQPKHLKIKVKYNIYLYRFCQNPETLVVNVQFFRFSNHFSPEFRKNLERKNQSIEFFKVLSQFIFRCVLKVIPVLKNVKVNR